MPGTNPTGNSAKCRIPSTISHGEMEGKQASALSTHCSFSNYLWDSFGTQHRLRCYAASSEWCADSRSRTDGLRISLRAVLPCCCLLPAHFNTLGKTKTIPELAQFGEGQEEAMNQCIKVGSSCDLSHRCPQSRLMEERLSIKNLRCCNPRSP